MVKEAIILAGGLGTRLKNIAKNVPKPMVTINGKPFLEYLLRYLNGYGIKRVILAVCYKSDVIKNYFGGSFINISISYSEEEELLGTGGAIKKALKLVNDEDVLILNGDTFFDIDIQIFWNFHKAKLSSLTLALKRIKYPDRYGLVKINTNHKIIAFLEKGMGVKGFINGGVYLLNREFFSSFCLPDKFSFEEDFLEKFYRQNEFYGIDFDSYFIDIGIPEEYKRALLDFRSFPY